MGFLRKLLGSETEEPASTPTRPDIWRSSAAAIRISEGGEDLQVVGESFYQDALQGIAGAAVGERVRVDVTAVLMAEEDNPYDANALSVWVDGSKVGHLSRDDAGRMRPGLIALQEQHGMPIALRGVISGGGQRADGPGQLGVFLRFEPQDFGLQPSGKDHPGELRLVDIERALYTTGGRLSDFDEQESEDTPARRRWSKRMRTDPHFRAIKLAHWQFQIDYALARGWPAPPNATGGIEFYGRIHDEWASERQLADPTAWKQESEGIAREVAGWRAEYEAKQAESDARSEIAQAELQKRPPTREETAETGKLDGRHYSEYSEELQAHLGAGRDAEAEALLLKLLDVIEDESEATGNGVAPWYYERLAILYAKRRDPESEVEVLERFARQRHAPGVTPPKLLQRLDKARKKLK